MSRIPCTGPRDPDQIFSDRCGAESTYRTPAGPRCGGCAARGMAAIREGACLLVLLAEQRGVTREQLLAMYVRIQ